MVADDEYDISLSRAALHRLVEEHFREVSASLPYFKRVKVLHFTDIELPRTATRKVKRREVVQIMESIEEREKSGRRGGVQETTNADALWLLGTGCHSREPATIGSLDRFATEPILVLTA